MIRRMCFNSQTSVINASDDIGSKLHTYLTLRESSHPVRDKTTAEEIRYHGFVGRFRGSTCWHPDVVRCARLCDALSCASVPRA